MDDQSPDPLRPKPLNTPSRNRSPAFADFQQFGGPLIVSAGGSTQASPPTSSPTQQPNSEAISRVVAKNSGEDTSKSPNTVEPLQLDALRIVDRGWGSDWVVRPCPSRRDWMDHHPHAYHCLPLVVANQWGWELLCPTNVTARWDGSAGPAGLTIEVGEEHRVAIKSQFGQGILTFSPPWLFRTSESWDLYTKGPSNYWKTNCVPLEGIVETWWLPYTFTMNWKFVEPGEVRFEQGEPIAQLIPLLHRTFEGSNATERPLSSEPALEAAMHDWRNERRRRAGHRHQNHLLYRKASDVEGHQLRVPVPSIMESEN